MQKLPNKSNNLLANYTQKKIFQIVGKQKNQRIIDLQGNVIGYMCSLCKKEFQNVKQLAGHTRSAHKKVNPKPEAKKALEASVGLTIANTKLENNTDNNQVEGSEQLES